MDDAALREQILELVGRYVESHHAPKDFEPGVSVVSTGGRVFGASEVQSLVDSALEFWLTSGRFNEAFESKLAARTGVRYALTVNSGSSANLLAVAALTSPTLKDRALRAGDEVVTVAAAFPTTVNPLLLYGLTPVFVDVRLPTYNIDVSGIEAAITPRTKAIVLAHTLGNPFELEAVRTIADAHGLWLIEDCCDALGSTYRGKTVGTFGDLATLSFFPAHHITTGEGGAVLTQDAGLKKLVESFRDWGRDCWCETGQDNTCGRRFGWKLGSLPEGYDHKYVFSHMGFNLKITDMQAAVGVAQLDRLDGFIAARKDNFQSLQRRFAGMSEFFILPEATAGSDPAWFGFPLTVRPGAPFKRDDLLRYLNESKVSTRLLFAGNITRQPYFAGVPYRVSGALTNTDAVMRDTFWLGVHPGLSRPMLDHVEESVASFVRGSRGS